ncbi:hypothetical protein MOJ79_07845 [Calidifontimicrobium sp. SYSU G02091]|uniref:hypothetical protein n=1 Tax=Calidifontimicrobium sp. SYSU G02091 TaxID=2926421 RepID=UPI001F53030E|nr:hypothetical protein [Calidifontimicrobium sp. SYSU G02091]MCI1191752.1 hypothetical protein [Calidifontimicrobium sp. SYSU G02091]
MSAHDAATPSPAPRVAVIAVHGVADQAPGQTVRELARLLCHGRDGAPRYVDGEVHEVLVPVTPLAPTPRAGGAASVPPEATLEPGRPSEFYLRQRGANERPSDLGLALTDHLLARYRPDDADGLYASTRVSLRRRADGTGVDLYELYWADCSRLQPGGIRALSAAYQLLFHLGTLARDVVDHVALAAASDGSDGTGRRALAALQRLHAWSAWLLTGPAALLQLAMLLLVGYGAAAFVPHEHAQLLLALGGGVAAVVLAIAAWLATQRAEPATAALARALPSLAAALAGAGIAATALLDPTPPVTLYALTAGLAMLAVGAALLQRYVRTVRGAGAVGVAVLAATAALLLWHGRRDFAHATTLREWMLATLLHVGEALLVALLVVWGVLVVVQMAALALSFALARAGGAVAASLATARIALSVSTALFVMLSLLLWSVVAYVGGFALADLRFEPALLVAGAYPSGAAFLEAQVRDVGALFTPLMALAGVVGTVAVVAVAPSLREELAPTAVQPTARGDVASARLGRWWTRARGAVAVLFGAVVPALALGSGAVYLLFAVDKLGGLPLLDALVGELRAPWGALLVDIGKGLAALTAVVVALGARFSRTFGKLRVALDAVLDVDNYFRDPSDRRAPRARIFSRYASLLDHVRRLGYARVVIVAHSQGSVISADLLRHLQHDGRLRALAGDAPRALVTLGSPLRDLYAARFPLLYRWMGPAPAAFAHAAPQPSLLGLHEWVNAYRSGDYVGRALWTPPDAAGAFDVARIDAQQHAVAARRDGRSEFCLGAGAHTHYFADDAAALAAEIDRLIAGASPHAHRPA